MDPSTLQRLADTPIGRRWVLKMGGASALAGTFASGGNAAWAAPAAGPREHVRSWKRRRNVYIVLPNHGSFHELTLRVAARDYPVRKITDRERRQLRRKGGLFGVIDVNRITHIAELSATISTTYRKIRLKLNST